MRPKVHKIRSQQKLQKKQLKQTAITKHRARLTPLNSRPRFQATTHRDGRNPHRHSGPRNYTSSHCNRYSGCNPTTNRHSRSHRHRYSRSYCSSGARSYSSSCYASCGHWPSCCGLLISHYDIGKSSMGSGQACFDCWEPDGGKSLKREPPLGSLHRSNCGGPSNALSLDPLYPPAGLSPVLAGLVIRHVNIRV